MCAIRVARPGYLQVSSSHEEGDAAMATGVHEAHLSCDTILWVFEKLRCRFLRHRGPNDGRIFQG